MSCRFRIILLATLVCNVLSQQQILSYIPLGNGPISQSPSLTRLPPVGIPPPKPNSPSLPPYPALRQPITPSALSGLPTSQKPKPTGVPTIASKCKCPPPLLPLKSSKSKSAGNCNGNLDSTVLNNLAVALQLLIVSNILNMPLESALGEETELVQCPVLEKCQRLEQPIVVYQNVPLAYTQNIPAYPQSVPTYPQNIPAYLQSIPIAFQSQSTVYQTPNPKPVQYYEAEPTLDSGPPVVPNAKYLGSSTDGSSSPYGVYTQNKAPRNGLSLMSPYEAIGPNSPYTDPIISSQYGNIISSKKDFQSPYAALLASDSSTDLFSF